VYKEAAGCGGEPATRKVAGSPPLPDRAVRSPAVTDKGMAVIVPDDLTAAQNK
jgi:hypothetical protein